MEKYFEVDYPLEGKSPDEVKKAHDRLNFISGRFGASQILPNEVCYVDSMHGFDGRGSLAKKMSEKLTKESGVTFDLLKVQSIAGLALGTQDRTLVPIYVDPTIVDQTRRLTPLVELVPRITNYGRTAEFNRLTARGVVGAAAEDANLNDVNDTFARTSVGIRFFYEVGRVTGPMQAASRPYLSQQYIDALNLEVRNKTISLRYVEEDTIINGDATTTRTAYGAVATIPANEYNGLRLTITTNNDAIGGAITIANLRTQIRRARTAREDAVLGQGDPNLILTDFTTMDNIKARLQDFTRYVNTNYEIAWGLKTLEFEGLPVLPSKFMPTVVDTRELLVLSLDTWQMRVLQDVTYEELAKVNDSQKFMIKVYEALIGTAEQFNGRMRTLSDAI